MESSQEIRDKIYVAAYLQVSSRTWRVWKQMIDSANENMDVYSQANDHIYNECAFAQNMSLIAERGAKRNFNIIKMTRYGIKSGDRR